MDEKRGELERELGLVHLYTGHGKGKTTASLGLAMRAIGQGYKVYMIQFLKGGGYTGEFITAKNFLQALSIDQFGKSCVREHKQTKLPGFGNGIRVRNHASCGGCRICFSIDEEEKMHAQRGFALAEEMACSGECDLVILDEVCGAVNLGLVSIEQVRALIASKHASTELVMTGRDSPKELEELADYVSHVEKVKHPFDKGIEARRGIEF